MYAKSTSFTAAVTAFLLCSYAASALAGSDPPRCRRSTRLPGPDASTIEGPDCFEVPGDEVLGFPGDNEFICYRTCIVEATGECEACLVRNRSLEIIAPKDKEKQELYSGRAIFSPRFLNMTVTYRPSTLCRYKVQCPTGQVLHYIITDHGLQEPQIVMGESRCVDFLSMVRSAYDIDPPGPQITCGNIESLGKGESSDFNDDNLSVMFRTNRKVQGNGFYMAVTCVSPDFYFVNGCTPAEPAQSLTPGSGRQRRDAEVDSLEQAFKIREKRFGFKVRCIKVPTDAAISYEDNTIKVFRGNKWLYKFRGIRVLQVYNRKDGYRIFYGSTKGRMFRGFGFLKIGKDSAFYIQEGVNPQFRLSELERTVVLQLWTEVLANTTLLASLDYDVDDGLDETQPGARGPRGRPAIDTVRLITNNTNACNGVVRATACIAQEVVLGRPCDC